jgi:hypothetical protein
MKVWWSLSIGLMLSSGISIGRVSADNFIQADWCIADLWGSSWYGTSDYLSRSISRAWLASFNDENLRFIACSFVSCNNCYSALQRPIDIAEHKEQEVVVSYTECEIQLLFSEEFGSVQSLFAKLPSLPRSEHILSPASRFLCLPSFLASFSTRTLKTCALLVIQVG